MAKYRIWRWSLFILALAAMPADARAQSLTPDQRALYVDAFDAAHNNDWDKARAKAAAGGHALLVPVIEWMRLSEPRSGASFAEIMAFLDRNPEWEGFELLYRRAEEGMGVATPSDEILAWYARRLPITTDGAMELARALIGAGRMDEARDLIREIWIDGDFGAQQEKNFLQRFGSYLKPGDHEARLDKLIWKRSYTSAQRMLPRVDVDYRALSSARIKLGRQAGGVDAAIKAVPVQYRDHPGLLFERIRWRRRKGLEDEALDLLWKAPTTPGQELQWWNERAYQARRLLQKGHLSEAYRLAAGHGQIDGFGFAEGEWLAGWIALRFLDDPDTAITHFNNMHLKVRYPVSQARAAYWAGRAAYRMGMADTARIWFEKAAQHVATFYGQMAATHLPADQRPPFVAPAPIDPNRIAAFNDRVLVRTVRLLAELGEDDLVRDILIHLDDTASDPDEQVLAGHLALELERHDAAVRAARRAHKNGMRLVPAGFPVITVPKNPRVEVALAHALIRQESGFIPDAISRAGARGLMQLMPATAKRTAKTFGLPYDKARLTSDPIYNMTIGQAHFTELLDQFAGSYVLSLAGYNAGAHRVRRWIKEYGDPRQGTIDPIDWIELIPFYETRDYVQRVLENLQVYRWRLTGAQIAEIPHDIVFR